MEERIVRKEAMERISKNSKVRRKPPNYAESRITASKGAWLVREGAIGNVPEGNALVAYFTLLVRIALTGHLHPIAECLLEDGRIPLLRVDSWMLEPARKTAHTAGG